MTRIPHIGTKRDELLSKYIPGGRHVGGRGGPDEAVVQGGVGRIRAVRVLETRILF